MIDNNINKNHFKNFLLDIERFLCYTDLTIKSARGTAPVTARQPAFVRCQRLTDGRKEPHSESPSDDGLFSCLFVE